MQQEGLGHGAYSIVVEARAWPAAWCLPRHLCVCARACVCVCVCVCVRARAHTCVRTSVSTYSACLYGLPLGVGEYRCFEYRCYTLHVCACVRCTKVCMYNESMCVCGSCIHVTHSTYGFAPGTWVMKEFVRSSKPAPESRICQTWCARNGRRLIKQRSTSRTPSRNLCTLP